MKTLRILPITIGLLGLAACTTTTSNNQTTSYVTYESYNYDDMLYFPQTNDANPDNYYYYPVGSKMNASDSYHLNGARQPQAHRDQDSSWVTSQKPQSYTIQLAAGGKASDVALKLLKAPKNARTAEVRSSASGGQYYQGLYGSYNNYQEAEQALNALPPELKSGASIKTFGTVQSSMN